MNLYVKLHILFYVFLIHIAPQAGEKLNPKNATASNQCPQLYEGNSNYKSRPDSSSNYKKARWAFNHVNNYKYRNLISGDVDAFLEKASHRFEHNAFRVKDKEMFYYISKNIENKNSIQFTNINGSVSTFIINNEFITRYNSLSLPHVVSLIRESMNITELKEDFLQAFQKHLMEKVFADLNVSMKKIDALRKSLKDHESSKYKNVVYFDLKAFKEDLSMFGGDASLLETINLIGQSYFHSPASSNSLAAIIFILKNTQHVISTQIMVNSGESKHDYYQLAIVR